ncbi:hypothetical protein [Phragmitibacter flavus]|uniref:hypothetical protein n=1 Tax=Phragmitibacter flavus TaxID=2576071 RepID=UPI00140A2842|nr:hypothetical protein [Phragmitibacter flavus]
MTPAASQQVVKEETVEEKITNPTVRVPSGRYAKSSGHLSNVTRHYSSSHKSAKESIFPKGVENMAGGPLSDLNVNVTVRAATGVVYDDNVFLRQNDKISSFIFTQTLGINVALGDYESRSGNYLALDYSPAYTYYDVEELEGEDNFSHQLAVEAQVVTGRWTFGGSAGYAIREGTSSDLGAVEIRDRVDLTSFQAGVNAKFAYTDRTLFVFSGSYSDRDYDEFIDSQAWTTSAGILTSITPKIQAGLTGVYGQVDADERGQEDFQQVLLVMNYLATGRVTLNTSLGAEFRQLDVGNDETYFVFGLSGQWNIRDGTNFAIEGHRNIEPSAIFPGVNTILTGASAGFSQRLFERFTLGVKGGYDHVEYDIASAPGTIAADYDYFFVRPSLSYAGRWFDVELYYLFRDLTSDDNGTGFDNSQVGLQISLTF